MAKYVCEYDTETKALAVTADGAAVPDVASVWFYAWSPDGDPPEFSMEVTSVRRNDDKSHTTVRVSASRGVCESISDYLRA